MPPEVAQINVAEGVQPGDSNGGEASPPRYWGIGSGKRGHSRVLRLTARRAIDEYASTGEEYGVRGAFSPRDEPGGFDRALCAGNSSSPSSGEHFPLSSPSAAVKTLASLWLIVFVQRTGSLAQLPSSRGGAAASQVDFIVDSRATTADYP